MKVRKKPIVVDAVFYNGKNTGEIVKWADGLGNTYKGQKAVVEGHHSSLHVRTLEYLMIVDPGFWVIRGMVGEFYVCRDDIFRQTYERLQ